MSTTTATSVKRTDLQRALQACRGSLSLVFLYSCAYNLLLLAPSVYLLQIYDRVLSSRSLDTLLMLTLIIVAAVLVDSILDALRRGALSRIGVWLEDRLRQSVFSAAFDHARQNGPGLAAEACRDLINLRQFAASPASAVLFDLPWAALFFGVLFLLHPLLGFIGAAGALVMLSCAFASEILTRAPLTRAQLAEANTHQRLGAALRNIHAIRAMGMLDGAARLVYHELPTAHEAQHMAMQRIETLQAISRSTRSLTQILIMGVAAWLVLRDHLGAGIIFVSSLLLGRGLAPLEGVIGSWKAIGSARFSYRRLNELLAGAGREWNEQFFPMPRPNGALTVDNLTFVPPGSTRILLQAVSIRILPGECVGVIGPSGAGKSTLARLIMGILAPTVGRVRLDGADMFAWIQGGGAKYLGYLPQDVELFEGSVKDNISRLQNADPDAVMQAASLVGVHETIMQLPNGYDTHVGEGGVILSGGQRQCIGLARAFFGSPQLIVLDEPNANLDDSGERALYNAIGHAKNSGASIIVITHSYGVLNSVDKIAIMRAGMISAFGTSDEIHERYFRKLKPSSDRSPEVAAASAAAGSLHSLPSARPADSAEASTNISGPSP